MERVWYKAYPEGVPKEIDPDKYENIVDFMEQSIKKFGDKPAFTNMDVTITFNKFNKLATAFAAFLQNHTDLKPGDVIAIQMPNLLQYPVVLLGAMKAGLVITNINPLYTEREMEHQLNDSNAKAIVILNIAAAKLEEIIKNTNVKHVIVTEIGDLFPAFKRFIVNNVVKHIKKMVPPYTLPGHITLREALKKGFESKYTPVKVHRDDILFLQYTGGTTGVSKGAMLTHRNLIANMEQIRAWMTTKLKEGEELIVTPLPLYHIFALTVNLLTFIKVGGHNLLITNPRDIPKFVKTLKKYKFTAMTGVNTLFVALLNHPEFKEIDFSHFKIAIGGGMALQSYTVKRWREVTGTYLAEGYGLTEASPVLTCQRLDRIDPIGTIGIPLPSTDIKLVDEEGNEITELNKPGELWAKGPQIMKGYLNRPEETAKTLTEDGWLKTGDIAVWFNDEGYLKIVDRKKDMILVSGFNVYPNEVEEVLSRHEGILEVAVIGVPDEKSGEAVKAFIVKKDPNLTEEDVRAFASENLTNYKRPKYIEFVDELPKSNIGKILRRKLREMELQKHKQQ